MGSSMMPSSRALAAVFDGVSSRAFSAADSIVLISILLFFMCLYAPLNSPVKNELTGHERGNIGPDRVRGRVEIFSRRGKILPDLDEGNRANVTMGRPEASSQGSDNVLLERRESIRFLKYEIDFDCFFEFPLSQGKNKDCCRCNEGLTAESVAVQRVQKVGGFLTDTGKNEWIFGDR